MKKSKNGPTLKGAEQNRNEFSIFIIRKIGYRIESTIFRVGVGTQDNYPKNDAFASGPLQRSINKRIFRQIKTKSQSG